MGHGVHRVGGGEGGGRGVGREEAAASAERDGLAGANFQKSAHCYVDMLKCQLTTPPKKLLGGWVSTPVPTFCLIDSGLTRIYYLFK